MHSPKPRVVIDARMVGPHGHGIANYVCQLAQGLAALPLPFEICFLLHRNCPPDSELRRLPHSECEIPFLHPRELWALADELEKLEPALYHSPSFSSLLRYPCPHVQTVHDLNHLHYGGLKEKAYYRFVLLPSLRQAHTLLSVSRTAAAEIEAWLRKHGVRRELGVAYNSILPFPAADDDAAVVRELGLEPGRYFFTLANAKPHKNLPFLERAYAAARARDPALPPLVLSVAGPSSEGIRRLGALNERAVGPLLRQAGSFFFPSLYEGFGRPPLEAALSGCAPVVSRLPVHEEVLAGVPEAEFLDPRDPSAWTEAFLARRGGRRGVSETSRSWISRTYSAEALAGTMARVYERALGEID